MQRDFKQVLRNALVFFLLLSVASCSSKHDREIRIAASSTPHAQILEKARDLLKKKGVLLKIIEVDDYMIPNRLVYENQVEANFFQHLPFLEIQNRQFGYGLVALTRVHIEPLALYSSRHSSVSELKQNASIALPNDPSNEARALRLLESQGAIELKAADLPTPLDILSNPLALRFEEVDAALLPRVLKDVDFAIIPANYALLNGLTIKNDGLAVERDSAYANIIAIPKGTAGKEEFKALAETLHSTEIQEFILNEFKGNLTPASN